MTISRFGYLLDKSQLDIIPTCEKDKSESYSIYRKGQSIERAEEAEKPKTKKRTKIEVQ